MKFENLEQFINASLINKAKWLREADAKDLATVMAKNSDFSVAVMETVGQEGRKTLNEAEIQNYETSLLKLMQIDFKEFQDS
jgi:hypothetical protein